MSSGRLVHSEMPEFMVMVLETPPPSQEEDSPARLPSTSPALRPPPPRADGVNQLQRPKRSAEEMQASITAKPRAAAAQARPERPLPPRAAPVRLPSSSRPSAAKRRRAPPTRSDPIVSESESSDDDSPQSRYLRDMLFFDPNKRAVEDARGRKVDAAAAAPSAAASASVLGRSDDDDDDDDERRHTSAAASAAHSVALKKEREKSEMDQPIAGPLRPRGGSAAAQWQRKWPVPHAAVERRGAAASAASSASSAASPAARPPNPKIWSYLSQEEKTVATYDIAVTTIVRALKSDQRPKTVDFLVDKKTAKLLVGSLYPRDAAKSLLRALVKGRAAARETGGLVAKHGSTQHLLIDTIYPDEFAVAVKGEWGREGATSQTLAHRRLLCTGAKFARGGLVSSKDIGRRFVEEKIFRDLNEAQVAAMSYGSTLIISDTRSADRSKPRYAITPLRPANIDFLRDCLVAPPLISARTSSHTVTLVALADSALRGVGRHRGADRCGRTSKAQDAARTIAKQLEQSDSIVPNVQLNLIAEAWPEEVHHGGIVPRSDLFESPDIAQRMIITDDRCVPTMLHITTHRGSRTLFELKFTCDDDDFENESQGSCGSAAEPSTLRAVFEVFDGNVDATAALAAISRRRGERDAGGRGAGGRGADARVAAALPRPGPGTKRTSKKQARARTSKTQARAAAVR